MAEPRLVAAHQCLDPGLAVPPVRYLSESGHPWPPCRERLGRAVVSIALQPIHGAAEVRQCGAGQDGRKDEDASVLRGSAAKPGAPSSGTTARTSGLATSCSSTTCCFALSSPCSLSFTALGKSSTSILRVTPPTHGSPSNSGKPRRGAMPPDISCGTMTTSSQSDSRRWPSGRASKSSGSRRALPILGGLHHDNRLAA